MVLNSNQLVYLYSLPKTSHFRPWVKEVGVFAFLVLWLVLFHIFGPRKDKDCCDVLVLCRDISNHGTIIRTGITFKKIPL